MGGKEWKINEIPTHKQQPVNEKEKEGDWVKHREPNFPVRFCLDPQEARAKLMPTKKYGCDAA